MYTWRSPRAIALTDPRLTPVIREICRWLYSPSDNNSSTFATNSGSNTAYSPVRSLLENRSEISKNEKNPSSNRPDGIREG
jgi:hypothetical protein